MSPGARQTIWVLGDQLTRRSRAFEGRTPSDSVVLLVETLARARARPYHKQKLVLLWSAMRHFAEELRDEGFEVDYHELAPAMGPALDRHLRRFRPARLRLMESAEHGASERLAAMVRERGIECDHLPNNLFLCNEESFRKRYRSRKRVLLEGFYRSMRRTTGILMDGDSPAGGKWNYDRANRDVPEPGHRFPDIPRFEPDAITRRVMGEVERRFSAHFGELDGFAWPVTRKDAELFRDDFLDRRLDRFGPFEDAMVAGEGALYHSLLSPLLNLGLLDPLDVCRRAESRYRKGKARLNSVEGFIRQILGWRELVHQVYRWRMPGYARVNALQAKLPLPGFYWTGDTEMRCVGDAVRQLRRNGINHHIQRLMVTGNFALIAGVRPQEVNEWYQLAYADAFEWVVSPNVLGLSLYADGGVLATKPYAASANYIHRMSDYCGECEYDRRSAGEETSCPFNSLYWDFLSRNRRRFRKNPRMNLVMAALEKKDGKELQRIRSRARRLRDALRRGGRI